MADKDFEFGGLDDHLDDPTAAKRLARDLIDREAPFAAARLIDIAKNSANDNTRLRANQEILARAIGPVGSDDKQGALDEFLEGIERIANGERRS